MKKFTLTLLSALFAVGAFAQVDKAKVTERFVGQPVELNAQEAPDKNPASRRGTPVIPYDGGGKNGKGVLGGYTFAYKTASSRNADPSLVATTDNSARVLITMVNDDPDGDPSTNYTQVKVDGFAFYESLTAYYYPDEDVLYIPRQSYAFYSSSYGWCEFAGLWYDEEAGGWYIGGAEVAVKADGTIDFGDYWFTRRIQSGAYAGYSLTPYIVAGGSLKRDASVNGVMEVSFDPDWSGADDALYPVSLTQSGNILTVDGFLGDDLSIDITLNADRTVTVPAYPIYYNDSHGYYYLATVDWASGYILAWGISGEGDETTISWGNFTGLSDDYYISDAYASAKIYFVDGVGQRYDYSNPETAAKAPRFGFGGGEGTTNIKAATAAEAVSESYVDVAGRKVTAATKGLVLKTVTYADGTKKTVKVINR